MTRQRDLDDVLREWVDLGEERLPQHNLAAALAEIDTTSQRGTSPALLEGFLMKMRPFAVPLAVVAVLVIAVGAFALISRPPSVGPSPSPTGSAAPPAAVRMNDRLTTAEFAVPVSVDLPSAPDPEGWFVSDGSAMVTITAEGDSQDRLVIIDTSQARVLTEGGEAEAVPDDVAAWLDDQPNVTAGPLPEGEGQLMHPVNGVPVPVFSVTAEPVGDDGRALIDTPIGPAMSVSDVASTWWLMRYQGDGLDLLLIATSEQDGEQGYRASFFQMIESIAVR
jgi:hypothetical protein